MPWVRGNHTRCDPSDAVHCVLARRARLEPVVDWQLVGARGAWILAVGVQVHGVVITATFVQHLFLSSTPSNSQASPNARNGEPMTTSAPGPCCRAAVSSARYLSEMTGDADLGRKATHVFDVLCAKNPPDGLYPIYIRADTAEFASRKVAFVVRPALFTSEAYAFASFASAILSVMLLVANA